MNTTQVTYKGTTVNYSDNLTKKHNRDSLITNTLLHKIYTACYNDRDITEKEMAIIIKLIDEIRQRELTRK